MLTILFLVLRATYVLVAGVWIGSNVFIAKLLAPALEEAGPAGGQLMSRMTGRVTIYMGAFGVATVVTGVYLLWHFTGGFDPSVTATHAGIAFSVGGVAGILAGVIGGAVVGRSATIVAALMREAIGMPDGTAKRTLVDRAAALRRRMHHATRVVVALQMTALVLMAVGHYV